MSVNSSRMLVACVGAVCLSGTSLAAVTNNYIAPEARSVEGGRDVRIVVGQAEIQANINALNTTAAAGGGLLFAMIDAGVNNARAKDAEKSVIPLREALVGYEFDPRAEMASAMTLSGLEWFGARQTQLTKDESADATLAALDAAATPQLMVMRYSYETTADFSAILVHLNTSLLNKAIPQGKKSTARLQPKNLAFVQSVRSVILLPDANPKDPDANVRAWSADGGRAARAALDLGIQRCQELLQRGLTQSAADAASMAKRNKRPLSSVPGVSGWEIEKLPTSTLVYEFMLGSLTQVETLGAAAAAPVNAAAPAADAPAPVATAAPAETAPAVVAPAAEAVPATPAQ
ncbi:MAG TPA: hypothetical protein VFO82_03365 [Steroidobacteraceae bacterium]|nr:hypothetical protein [Steroidobacteraceae bacterium]